MSNQLVVLKCPECKAKLKGPGTCLYCGAEVRELKVAPEEPSPAPAWVGEVCSLMDAGQKIAAIRLARWHTDWDLRDSNELVEGPRIRDPELARKLPIGKTDAPPAASCFPASALVSTPLGPIPICEAYVGTQVWSWDKGLRVAHVTSRIEHTAARLWRICFADGTAPIETTQHHTFLSGSGWARTDHLKEGDSVVFADRVPRIVLSVQPTDRITSVFNLHTSGAHTFVVDGAVVHNFSYFRQARTLLHRFAIDPFRQQSSAPHLSHGNDRHERHQYQ